MCKSCSLVEIIAFITTCIALTINAFGVFSQTWWLDRADKQYGIFTTVDCKNNLCELTTDKTYGWMVVAQVTSLVQMIALVISLVIQLAGTSCYKYQTMFLNIIVLGISCFFSVLHIFILISVYANLMEGYKILTLPENYVYFQTLPVGLNAIAGTVTIPPLVTMLVLYTKQRKAKRDAVKEAEKQHQREESIKKRGSVGTKEKTAEETVPQEACNA